MKTSGWTAAEVMTLFGLHARNTLLTAEADGRIPKAHRVRRGQLEVRSWAPEQLPAIGALYGWLKPPRSTRVICVYTAKGGVLKSTLSYTLGRILALNGISVLLIGLDIQGSLTDLALNPLAEAASRDTPDDFPELQGLNDVFAGRASIESVIAKTDLPTLDIIPETATLGVLEKRLRDKPRREYWLRSQVIDKLRGKYQVVIIDNSPNWNLLIENALTAANVVISPIGCDIGSYQALDTNLASTVDFRDEMGLKWDAMVLVPTLYERTKLSTQILRAYLTKHSDMVTQASVRRAVRGQEALACRRTPLERDPRSDLATDYRELVEDIWGRILAAEQAAAQPARAPRAAATARAKKAGKARAGGK